jgi:hypothetical protein
MQIEDVPYPVCDAGFSGSEFGVQGMKLSYRERERERLGRVRNLGNSYSDFHHFPSEMCRQAGFFNGGKTFPRPVFFAKPVLALTFPCYTTSSSLSNENVSLLQGHCFDTMSLLRLTLLRLGNVAPISVCLNAPPKMGPGAA